MKSYAALRSLLLRYGLAILAVGIGLAVYCGLSKWLGSDLPAFVTFYPGVIVAAWFGGLGPGLFATALAALAVDCWIQEPLGLFAVSNLRDGVALGLFTCLGIVLTVAADRYQRSQEKLSAFNRKKALYESEERLRFALEASHTGAWDLDLVDHTANRSIEHDRIFGYSGLLPEWSYEKFLEHVLPEDRETVDRQFRRALTDHSDWDFECRIRR